MGLFSKTSKKDQDQDSVVLDGATTATTSPNSTTPSKEEVLDTIRGFFENKGKTNFESVVDIDILHREEKVQVNITSERPAEQIGKGGSIAMAMAKTLTRLFDKKTAVTVKEVGVEFEN